MIFCCDDFVSASAVAVAAAATDRRVPLRIANRGSRSR